MSSWAIKRPMLFFCFKSSKDFLNSLSCLFLLHVFQLRCNYFCEFRSFLKFIYKRVESTLKIWNLKIEVDIDNAFDDKVSDK